MADQSKLSKLRLVVAGIDEETLEELLIMVQEQMKEARKKMSPNVQKLLKAFDLLSDEERDQVRSAIKPVECHEEMKTEERRISSGEPDKIIDPYEDEKEEETAITISANVE